MRYYADIRLDRRTEPAERLYLELEAESASEAVRQLSAFEAGMKMPDYTSPLVHLERLATSKTRKVDYRRIS